MGKCTSCGAALEPAWKFCIACGTAATAEAVDDREGPPSAHEPVPTAHEPIPAAIRPDADADPAPATRSRRPDLALLLGILFGVGGVILIIIVAVALFTPRG